MTSIWAPSASTVRTVSTSDSPFETDDEADPSDSDDGLAVMEDEAKQPLAELERLNHEYERRFGFSFVVFVNGRTRAELVPVLRERLARTRTEELEAGLRALCEIARARWERQGWTRIT